MKSLKFIEDFTHVSKFSPQWRSFEIPIVEIKWPLLTNLDYPAQLIL